MNSFFITRFSCFGVSLNICSKKYSNLNPIGYKPRPLQGVKMGAYVKTGAEIKTTNGWEPVRRQGSSCHCALIRTE